MNKLIYPTFISIATMFVTAIFTPTPAHAITGEEAVKVIKVFGEYVDNLQKIFQPTPTAPQPQQNDPIPTTEYPLPQQPAQPEYAPVDIPPDYNFNN
jgi:hypothetical protein